MTPDRRGATLDELEQRVGLPERRWEALVARITDEGIERYAEVERDWLNVMWCLDAYRSAGIPPRGMGNSELPEDRRLAAIYRGKGGWFSTLITALLVARTRDVLDPRRFVSGFSQTHQVEITWPRRPADPELCVWTGVTGAPADESVQPRGATDDFVNRRKEIKFAALDLKLHRHPTGTSIDWEPWRHRTQPQTYFLWAARLREAPPSGLPSGGRRRENTLEAVMGQAEKLVKTYLDGVGLCAWKLDGKGTRYEPVPIPHESPVPAIDAALDQIAAHINRSSAGRDQSSATATGSNRLFTVDSPARQVV